MIALTEHQGVGVLWTTHLIDEVRRADRIVVLRQGSIVYDGPWQALLEGRDGEDLTEILIAMMENGVAAGVAE